MTTTVTMVQSRRGEDGNPWLVGQSYAASDGFAAMLITANYATGTLPINRDLVPIMGQTNSAGQVTSLVSGDGNPIYPRDAAVPTALIAPGDGQTLTTVVGAGATLDASGTEMIDGEQWRWYTITGTGASSAYVEVVVPDFEPLSADSMALHWRSSVIASNISATSYLGTTAFATSASSSGGSMSAASTTVYRGHSGTIGAPSAYTELTKNSYSRDTSEQLWTAAKIRFAVPNGTTTTIRLRSLYAGLRRRRGRIAIIADDGTASFHKIGVQILARYGLLSTSGIIADRVGATSYFTTEQRLQEYVSAGNLCVAHGPTGGAGNLFSVNATDDAAISDMQYHRDWLLAKGLTNPRGAKCYIWPQGQWTRTAGDPAFLDLAWDAGFRVGRIADVQTSRYVNASQVASGRWNLLGTTFGHRYAGAANTADDAAETTNVTNILTRAAFVAESGLDSYITLHEVVARGAASTTIQIETDRLHTLCAGLQALVAAGTLECPTMDAFVPA